MEEEDPEWVDIDVKDIEKNKVDFQPVPLNNILNRKAEELNNHNDLDKSDDNNSKDDDDALYRLGKIIYNNKIPGEIIHNNCKFNFIKEENTNQVSLNILSDKNILDANDLFEMGNTIKKKEENIIKNKANSDEKKNEVSNFDATELQSTLAGLNFFDIFINENNHNLEGNILEGSDEALMKNLFVSQNSINSSIFNINGNRDLIENSPDKQNILLKTLNFTSEIQKNIFQGRKESGDNEAENQRNLDLDEQKENSINKIINSNQKDDANNTKNSYQDINKDLIEKFTAELKVRGINPENFNFNMANANFNNMIFNANNFANIIKNENNINTNINNNKNKNIMNNNLINNRMNISPNAIPNMIPPPNMIPYPLLNREMIINNMIQQGLIKPNLNLNSQRQNLTPHQIQYSESLKNATERDKNSNVNVSNSGYESFKDKSLMHQSFLENPITVVEKNLVKKCWAIMDDKSKPIKFLNSIELQNHLETEKKKNNITKMNFICDYESDMYFKPADLLEELLETMPKLIENLNTKHQQQKMQTGPPMIPDMRMMGFPFINPVAMQQNFDKDNPAFNNPGIPINLNPLMIDQRIVNMIPHFPHIANVRGNNMNNNFNRQAVNMNINLQFVNNEIKLNNIMIDNNENKNNYNAEDNNEISYGNNRNNNSQPNKKDYGSNNNTNNVNMIPPGFNKNILQNYQKGNNIPPGFPTNPNFNMAAVNNIYFSAVNQMMHINNPINKGNQNNTGNNNNVTGQNVKNKNNNIQDGFSNIQNETITKNDLNSFFGSNVFYESTKQNNNNNNNNINNINNNRVNDQIKADKNVNANDTNNLKGNKTTETNKPSNLTQIVNFKGNVTNNKNQNYKK
jgi:hypothetical protein